MQFSRPFSLDFKMALSASITGAVALLVATTILLVIQGKLGRQRYEYELKALGDSLAKATATALASSDRRTAAAVFATLPGREDIVEAVVLWRDGSEFLRYDSAHPDKIPDSERQIFATPILVGSNRIGTLRLEARYRNELPELVKEDIGGLALLLLTSLGLGLLTSSPLRASIVLPLQRLLESIRRMNERGNYAARAEVNGPREMRELAQQFNQALVRMDEFLQREEKQVAISRRMIQDMENEADARERAEMELQEARQRYEVTAVAMLGTSDGLWDWDLTTNGIVFSPRWKSMLGFEDHEVSNSYETWMNLIYPEERESVAKQVQDYLAGRSATFELECRMRRKPGDCMWALYRGAALRDSSGKPFRFSGSQTDITARKIADAGLEQLHRQMIETSRFAGMAEVATGVLHNVGNVLNSVNVSATLISDRLRESKVPDLAAAAALFKEHTHDLPAFLANDPKGRVLPGYLRTGLDKLKSQHLEMLKELDSLRKNIGHIKEVVAMQQSYARASALTETLTVAELVEEALGINETAFQAHPVQIVRRFQPVPQITVDRHKVVQILVNLLSNARHAMEHLPAAEQRIELAIETNERGAITVAVRDNGVGISQENLTHIFRHGFTTRKNGHGFGLHSSANAAKEMGGSLGVWSDGTNRGACFILELPITNSNTLQKAA